jgi:nitrite reductase/ring-hydroxylating ferredoxin subunit
VHAASNAVALTAYTASLAARRRGARGRGKLLGLAGFAALSAGGFLGGHMTYAQGVGPNQTAFDRGPTDWQRAADLGDLPDRELHETVVADTPVLLSRLGSDLYAIHGRCSHRGCSLAKGELDGTVVTCPCHGSRFDLRDGSVVRGPAFAPQPAYDTRQVDGSVEIRSRD